MGEGLAEGLGGFLLVCFFNYGKINWTELLSEIKQSMQNRRFSMTAMS